MNIQSINNNQNLTQIHKTNSMRKYFIKNNFFIVVQKGLLLIYFFICRLTIRLIDLWQRKIKR